jgi:VWFA-related protein
VSGQSTQDPPAPAGTGLVHIAVAVERFDGTAVKGLRQSDFEIISDGQSRPIEYFSTADSAIAVVLLLDLSASNPVPLDVLAYAADQALLQPRIPADFIRVGGIAKTLTMSPRLTADRAEARRAARTVLAPRYEDRVGPSPVWDALYSAIGALEPDWHRRAVVVVTDGRATGNVHGMDEVTSRAVAAGISINIVAVPTGMMMRQGGMLAARVRPTSALAQMATATGGAYTEIEAVDQLPDTLVRTMSRLHWQYAIGFQPTAFDGLSHSLEVRVKRTGVSLTK